MKISLLVPTFRRPEDLCRCLTALQSQARLPDEMIVIVRDVDTESVAFLKEFDASPLPLRTVIVSVPGQVAGLNAGLDAAQGDIIAITDDDAAPWTDWLQRIEAHFAADERVGGVGGRDQLFYENGSVESRTHPTVGRVQWQGRVTGNHHLGTGAPRRVRLLKGVNMSYRRAAIENIRFDTRLRGVGAQVHNDLAFSLLVDKAGWHLVYDPAVAVDHYPAARKDADTNSRGIFHAAAYVDLVYNETLVLLTYLTALRQPAYLAWSSIIGTRATPGLLMGLYLAAGRQPHSIARFMRAAQGRLQAVKAFYFGRDLHGKEGDASIHAMSDASGTTRAEG